ncbi:MAG TPA: hypothetical protein VFB96_22835 [Pirellulaceae bacterium]|nr:hypothetical protein [Pirellulaceae bacterium]
MTTAKPAKFIRRRDTWLWDMLGGRYEIPMGWFASRFRFLGEALQKAEFRRDAAIVPQRGDRSNLASVEISGGRDVKYVIVYAREVPESWQPGIQETLIYRRDVAGTDLVYDLTGEFLQGKARPFECDLRKLPLRVYAVLPFQVESLDLAIQQRVEVPEGRLADHHAFDLRLKVSVRFLDAAGSVVAGRIPVAWEICRHPAGEPVGGYSLVDAEAGDPTEIGAAIAPEDGKWTFAVRSLLTGDEATLPFSLVGVAGDRAKETSLGSEGLTVRRAPRPVQLDNL